MLGVQQLVYYALDCCGAGVVESEKLPRSKEFETTTSVCTRICRIMPEKLPHYEGV
jgi:hypothetical protein